MFGWGLDLGLGHAINTSAAFNAGREKLFPQSRKNQTRDIRKPDR
jgi:hypothetical protein